MFKNPFSFDGRIRRMEFGLTILIYYAIIFIPSLLLGESSVGSMVLLVLLIPALWFFLAQGAKRCHDLGKSGWWQIIPFYGLWMLFQDGQQFSNDYGHNPKGINITGDDDFVVDDSEILDSNMR